MESLLTQLKTLWQEATTIWLQGGGAMIAIAVIAVVMFGVGMNIHFKLERKGFLRVPERKWRRWIREPELRKGPIGRLLNEVQRARTVSECGEIFDRVRLQEVTPFSRDLLVMKICVSAAPLVGLLGTVIGMLATFGALSTGSGGAQTMDMVAGGISEALITTETGLVIALPGLFFQYQLVRKHERYKAFLAHLETVCTQSIFHQERAPSKAKLRAEAKAQLAQRIRQQLQVQTTA